MFETAISLDANDLNARTALAVLMNSTGQPEKTLALIAENFRRSPRDTGSDVWRVNLGHAHLLLGQYELAIEHLVIALATRPDALLPHTYLAAAYAQMGDLASARAVLAEAIKLEPDLTIAWLKANTDGADANYFRLAEGTLYDGLRKAGLAE